MNTFSSVVNRTRIILCCLVCGCVVFVAQAIALDPKTTQNDQSTMQIISEMLRQLFDGVDADSSASDCDAVREVQKEIDRLSPDHPDARITIAPEFTKPCQKLTPATQSTSPSSASLSGANLTPRSCAPKVNAAVDKIISNPHLLTVYKDAAEKEGIQWEILAAIHYLEAGSNPRLSLISGRPIGTPEPDNHNKVYTSLFETAVDAAREYKRDKLPTAMSISGKDENHIETLAAAFALYNGSGNKQCRGSNPKSLAPGYTACPPTFNFHDHIYPMSCFDEDHEKMYVIYCGDGRQCDTPTVYQNIGALTLMRALGSRSSSDRADEGQDAHTRKDQLADISTWTYYPQCNGSMHTGPWVDQQMTGSNGHPLGCTYCNAACGLNSVAMIVTHYKSTKTPVQILHEYNQYRSMTCDGAFIDTLTSILQRNGVRTGSIKNLPKLSMQSREFEKIVEGYTSAGSTLLTLGYFNGIGHYVWVVGKVDGDILIMDPYYGRSSPIPLKSSVYRSTSITYIVPVGP